MRQVEEEIESGAFGDEFVDRFEDDPYFFTVYRIYFLLVSHGRVMSSSVPFVHRLFFLPVILVYVTAKRIEGLLSSPDPVLDGHVFCCHSASDYKTVAFFELVDAIANQTSVLAVSGAKEQFLAEEYRSAADVVTFGELFTLVSPLGLLRALPRLWSIAAEMGDRLEIDSRRHRVIAFNFLVTEYVKTAGLQRSLGAVDSFHTYAPMPYQVKSVDPSDLYAYQHGVETLESDRSFATPPYVPINYFVWGEPWIHPFQRKAHPDAQVHAVGSPRLDRMFRRRSDRPPTFDVLFISGSHVLDQETMDADAYRAVVDEVVDVCTERDWSLRIKLHPLETAARYEDWDLDRYVTDETDLEALLSEASIAVTEVSSAFVESVVMGTPVVVAQQSCDAGLERYAVSGARFPETISGVRREMGSLMGTRVSQDDFDRSDSLVVGKSIDRITDVIGADVVERPLE